EARLDVIGNVHTDLQGRLRLPGVLDAIGAIDQARAAVDVAVERGAGDRDCARRIGARSSDGVLNRLAMVVEATHRQQPAPAASVVANVRREAVAVVTPARAVSVKAILREIFRLRAGDKMVRQA